MRLDADVRRVVGPQPLGAGSRDHHRLHKPGTTAKLDPDGTFHITGPDGTTRTTHPPGLRDTLWPPGAD